MAGHLISTQVNMNELMKKFLAGIICMLSVVLVNAQFTSFHTEHDKFMKDFEQFMTNGKMEVNVKTMEQFDKMVKDGKISSAWLDKIVATTNLMVGKSMAPYPYFNHYLTAVMNAVNGGKSDAQFSEWSDVADNIIPDQKKGDNSNFSKFIEFSKDFFLDKALNTTPAKTWKVETDAYKLNYEDGKPSVTFPSTTLLGCIKGDTLSIKQTAGTYYPLETKWVGKSGRVDWARAGFDANKVFCTFKEYTINTSNFNYGVDTVYFSYPEYFKQPLQGKMQDKMVSSTDSNQMTYPRFESYAVGMTMKDIAPNVVYTGGFSLHGSRVLGYGTPENRAELIFYAKDGKTKILSAKSQNLSIRRGQELSADKAEVAIYFGDDSIYHPQLNLVYKVQKREMRLLRGETGIGQAKFTDSYHNDEFQTDAIFWNLDSSVLNLKILSGVGKKPGVYESVNYFNRELMHKLQGLASYEPLAALKHLVEKNNSRDVNTVDFAHALDPHLTVGEVRSLVYELLGDGFILYNEEQEIITVKDKTINYVLAKGRKIDFDIITMRSAPQSGNDNIDLKNSNINLKGVFEVPISDTAYVYFRPKNYSISLQKDRNMQFDGLVYAGRMDFIGEKFKFQYAPFTVDLNKVDTMRINIPDSGKVDKYGEPILKPMKSKVEGIKGLLEVDAPLNKSGRRRLPQFPKLISREKSYIYYDDPAIAKGAYGRKNFFFELEPFKLDSLDNFSTSIINWKGTLVSGGIFPDVKDSVHLQDDASLGYKSESPENGFDLYKGKGRYYGKYELNYSGLSGDGRITHSTADFTTHDVHLYPDSMRGTTDTFTLTKTFTGVKTPHVVGTEDMIFWKPVSDSMHIIMTKKEHPFAMYDDTLTSFKGNLLLTGVGLKGNGTLDWDQATLTSKEIALRTMDLSSDTASLNIKTTGDKVSFKTPNVSAKVDFKTRIGDFKSNQINIPTDFSYNQYNTAINEFKWFMDEKILDFKAPAAGQGAYFNSTRPDQKGLRFLGKRATYNLVTSVLRIEQIPEIRVADASVIPDSNVVIIEAEAKMHQLRNAVIYADTITKFHRFDSCVVDIYSKEELKAIGNYHYTTKDIKEIIRFGDIGTQKTTQGAHKKAHDLFTLTAKTNIDEKQQFVLYPNVNFNGEASILSSNPAVTFKGYAKIGLTNPKAATSQFFINQDVDPSTLALKYDDKTKDNNNNPLSAGIHLSPLPDAPLMYTTLLAPKKDNKDVTIFKTAGIVAQMPNGEYVFGDENRIKDKSKSGNVLRYDDKKGTIKGEGKFELGTNFGVIKTAAAGSAEAKLDSGKYKLNLDLAIDAQMGDKMQDRFEFYMIGDDADQPDISYDNDKQRKAIRALADEDDDKRMLEDFDKTAAFLKRPKAVKENLVFTDVNFVFDPDDISLRSVGKIGVAMIGKKVINKKLEGYIEVQYKGGNDVFTIYLQTGTKGWVYFEYRPGILSILSSYDDINNNLKALAPDKRRIKGDGKAFYMYTAASPLNKQDFVDYMKDKANGVVRPRPEPRAPQEEIPVLVDTSSIPENVAPGDSLGGLPDKMQQELNQMQQIKSNGGSLLSAPPADRNKTEAPKTDDMPPVITDPEQIKEQQQIKETEQMKMNGGNVLSGAPPDRNPAPVKKDTAQPVVPVTPDVPKQENVVPAQPVTPDVPKKDTVPAVTPVTPDIPKKDTVPAVQPPKSEGNAPVQPVVPDVPKQEITPPVQTTTPKQDTVPPVQQTVPDVPKQESVVPSQPVVPDATKQEITPPAQTTTIKQDSIAPVIPAAPKVDSLAPAGTQPH